MSEAAKVSSISGKVVRWLEFVAVGTSKRNRSRHLEQSAMEIITAKILRSLMRKYRVTIRELAKRIGTTQRRVREYRNGNRPFTFLGSLDWWQAITGEALTPRMRAQLRQYVNNGMRID